MRNRIERSELIQAVRSGGESVRAAATRLGVPISTAQRWVRIAGAGSSPKPRFVEAVLEGVAPASSLRVRVGAAELEIRAGFDAKLLRDIVTALGADA